MNRWADILHETPDPQDAWTLDPMALVAEGEHRLARRRRQVRGGVVAAVAAAAALAFVVPRVVGDRDEPPVIDPAPAPGVYQDVPLERAEMERVCSAVLNARNDTDARYVAGRAPDGTAVPSPEVDHYVETREGWAVELAPAGSAWPARRPFGTEPPTGTHITPAANRFRLDLQTDVCVIPQQSGAGTGQAPIPLPAPTDATAIIEGCSDSAGFDFSGWEVVAAVRRTAASLPDPPSFVDAVLLSTNGQAAHCWLAESGTSGVGMIPRQYLTADGEPLLLPEDADPAVRFAVVVPTPDPTLGIGLVPGLPDGWSIRILADRSPVTTVTTPRGGFAYALPGPIAARTWTAEVRDAEGEAVWDGTLEVGTSDEIE